MRGKKLSDIQAKNAYVKNYLSAIVELFRFIKSMRRILIRLNPVDFGRIVLYLSYPFCLAWNSIVKGKKR